MAHAQLIIICSYIERDGVEQPYIPFKYINVCVHEHPSNFPVHRAHFLSGSRGNPLARARMRRFKKITFELVVMLYEMLSAWEIESPLV